MRVALPYETLRRARGAEETVGKTTGKILEGHEAKNTREHQTPLRKPVVNHAPPFPYLHHLPLI